MLEINKNMLQVIRIRETFKVTLLPKNYEGTKPIASNIKVRCNKRIRP